MLDRAPDGSWVPGGPSLYAARIALALGPETELLTRLPAGYPGDLLDGLRLHALAATGVPRYVNTYDGDGNRQQLLIHEGEPIPGEAFAAVAAADVLFLAPAFHEFEAMPALAAKVRAVSLQGILRSRDGDRVVPRTDAFEACGPFASEGVLCFFSDEDTAEPRELARHLAAMGATVAVTHGREGATLSLGAEEHSASAFEATSIDPTGAGDAFAMAFTVCFAESGDAQAALRFGLMAGALAVEGVGFEGVPSRAAIERRLSVVNT